MAERQVRGGGVRKISRSKTRSHEDSSSSMRPASSTVTHAGVRRRRQDDVRGSERKTETGERHRRDGYHQAKERKK